MSTPALVPFVQFDERVVGENHPTFDDVDNRVSKFLITQSDLDIADPFPGFMVKYSDIVDPEGVQIANVGHVFINTVGETFWIKVSSDGLATGWKKIGGNDSGNGDPESVITASIGQIYEQRDATTDDNAIWVKASGTSTNTGWRRILGSMVRTSSAIIVGINADDAGAGTDAILVGNDVNADGAQAISVGKSSAANGANAIAFGNGAIAAAADSIGIGRSISIDSACIDGIAIGRQNILAATGIVGMIVIGAGNTAAEDGQIIIGSGIVGQSSGSNSIFIGNSITVTGAGVANIIIGNNITTGNQSSDIIIGNGSSLSGASGVAIGATCSSGASAGGVYIRTTVSGGSGGNGVVIGGVCTVNTGCTAIGIANQVSAANAVIVGAFTVNSGGTSFTGIGSGSVSHDNCIALGQFTSFAAQVFSVGTNVSLNPINTVIVGHGSNTQANPTGVLYRQTNASGTNNAAGHYTVQPGLSTGDAAEGAFKVQTGDAGGSGTTLQTATVKFVVGRTVAIGTTVSTTAALSITLAGTHCIATTVPRCIFGGTALNTFATAGMTINQGGNDDEILSLKSSDITHGITDIAETDTYGRILKVSPTTGGIFIDGMTSATIGALIRGSVTTENATRSVAGQGAVEIRGSLKATATVGVMSADQNILVVRNHTTTRFILDTDGDSHQDVGTAWTNFDAHDDIALLNKLSAHVTRHDDPLRKSFGSWLQESRDELQNLKLVTFNEDGHHFVNMSRLTMLHTGAIRQLGERFNRIEKALISANLLPATC